MLRASRRLRLGRPAVGWPSKIFRTIQALDRRLDRIAGQCWPSAVAEMLNFLRGEMASLRAILSRSSGHQIVEYNAIGRAAQLLEKFRSSKSSRDASQRVELRTLIFF